MPTEWLNIFLLIGILMTAIFTIFKAGGWFNGVIHAIETMKISLASLERTFHDHTADEKRRFAVIDTELATQKKTHSELKEMIAKVLGQGVR